MAKQTSPSTQWRPKWKKKLYEIIELSNSSVSVIEIFVSKLT
jgi:hypothetical protein